MASLTLTLVSGLGTSTKTLTFSASDAGRILSAFQKLQAGGTQDQLAGALAANLQMYIARFVVDTETVLPTPPVLT